MMSYQYMTSLYTIILINASNELGPRNNIQLIYFSFFLILGAIINASIFGQIYVIVESINKHMTVFLEKIDTLTIAMKNMSLPHEI